MRPILFELGPVIIGSHPVFVTLGVATALLVTIRIAKRKAMWSQELYWIICGGLVGGALFARLGLLLRYVQEAPAPSLAGFVRFGGLTLLGGLAGAYAGVVVTKRLIGYRRHTGDTLAPGVALGIAVGRIGCFLAERPGTETALPWGVRVPPGVAAGLPDCEACSARAAMHPSFLYESAFLALAGLVLLKLVRQPASPAPWMGEGDLFKLFLAAYAIFRFFVEFVRGNPVMAFGLSGSQLTVAVSTLVLALYFLRRWRSYSRSLSVATA